MRAASTEESSVLFSQTNQEATLMKAYSRVQAIGKARAGGVQLGFCKERYHVPGLNWEPNHPAEKEAIKQINSTNMLFMLNLSLVYDLRVP
jgi:hypothetical protein